MNKIGLGTIGTSWITNSFIDSALATDKYELKCVYSRTTASGEEFSKDYGKIAIETDLDKFVNREDLDVIYIASPNSLHYEQTLQALRAKKHVMVEKPAVINVEQWDEMIAVAKENDVFVLEAARHMYIPNLEVIQKEMNQLGNILGAVLPYAKYSSRYDAVLDGEEPNIFSLDFAGGALMDLGIYPVYTAVALFGEPKEVFYFASKIRTGVDGSGTAILRYDSFDVTILVGKNLSTTFEAEIYGEKDTLVIDQITEITKAYLVDAKSFDKKPIELQEQYENNMYYEADHLADMIHNQNSENTMKEYKKASDISRIVAKVLYELRHEAEIIFSNE